MHFIQKACFNAKNIDEVYIYLKFPIIILYDNQMIPIAITKNNNIVEASMQNMENSFAVIVKLQDEIVGYIYGLREKRGVIRIL